MPSLRKRERLAPRKKPKAVCSEVEPQHREPTNAGAGDLLRREACVDNAGGSITVQTAVGGLGAPIHRAAESAL